MTEVPALPSYRDLDDRTWVQLRECVFLAETALAHLSTREDRDLARSTLVTMVRILSPEWDGKLIVQHPLADREAAEGITGLQ